MIFYLFPDFNNNIEILDILLFLNEKLFKIFTNYDVIN